jgi:hypothetical protein
MLIRCRSPRNAFGETDPRFFWTTHATGLPITKSILNTALERRTGPVWQARGVDEYSNSGRVSG